MFARERQYSTIQLIALFFIILLATAGLYLGWRLFWFLTDDAYIAFRYVSNSQLGFGYTWNPPPFRAVEGYTSYLWVLLLDVVWRLTGIEPPDSANVISLLFACGTTFLGIAMLLKMELKDRLHRVRLLILVLVLLGALTNRTYLAWTSSGLETAMFNFFTTAWVFSCFFVRPNTPRWLGWMALTSVLAALTRPDGLLLVVASLFLSALTLTNWARAGRFRPRHCQPLTPFLLILAHFLWRKSRYGQWLPNTHTAKFVAPWPESGLRYALAFIVEYALWFWLALVLVALVVGLRFLAEQRPWQKLETWSRAPAPTRPLISLTVVGALLAHWAYYTFLIGGDHFEYRVYSHLVLLVLLSSVWLLNALKATAFRTLAYLGLFVLCALPIPWAHWAATHDLDTREETHMMRVPIAAEFPAIVRPYVDLFDSLQFWLIERHVGMRHQEHKVFAEHQLQTHPPRSSGIRLSPESYPVLSTFAVGAPGWVLPTTHIIDTDGLNDYVVARNPVAPGQVRRMAHERYPPAGYPECFRPNVEVVLDNKLVVTQRELAAETIVDCEHREWPPSEGNKQPPNDFAINGYLWGVWPEDPLYLYYVPPEQDGRSTNEQLLGAFPAYAGVGCLLAPPEEKLAGRDEYVFAFLAAPGRPALPELAALFPWTRMITEPLTEQPSAYHLGYAAPAGPEMVPQPGQPLTAAWGDQLHLLGYDLARASYQPGESIDLTLYYRTAGSIEPGHSVFVHLVGAAHNPATGGPLWGQDDGAPCRGLYPMEHWPPGSTVAGSVAVPIPRDAPPGDYELVVGLYNWQTGERVRLSGEMAGQDSLTLARIQIEEPVVVEK